MPKYPSNDGKYPGHSIVAPDPGSPVDLFCATLLQVLLSSQAAHLPRPSNQNQPPRRRPRRWISLSRGLSRRLFPSKKKGLSASGSMRRWLYHGVRRRGIEFINSQLEEFLQSSGSELQCLGPVFSLGSSKYRHVCHTLTALAQVVAAGVNDGYPANLAKPEFRIDAGFHRQ